jgi:Spermine/spermidine synthase domain
MSATSRPLRTQGLRLAVASCLALFLELTLIRWLPAQVRVTAYFPNLVLLAAFLGLGVGSLRSGRRSLLGLLPAVLSVTVLVSLTLGRIAFTDQGVSEHLWLLYYDLPTDAPVVAGVRTPIVVLFVLTAVTFVPIGQFVAERIQDFREASVPLRGYAVDLAGSLLGVVGFGVLSGSGTRPAAWFGAVTVLAVFLVLPRRPMALLVGVVGLGLTVLIGRTDTAKRYSPYYALSWGPEAGTPDVSVRANGSLHQVAIDLVNPMQGQPAWRTRTVEGYHAPYEMLGRPPRRALVLGAGTGNDVAVLLQEGATDIDAVEIDPQLVELGREIHPDHPYDSDRVHVHVTDARSFLEHTDKRYDLIVFGTLDSMTRLAALSTVRLDNFVYTKDAILAAKRHLTPDGGMALYFMVGEAYIHDRLIGLLASTFGTLPRFVRGDYSVFNTVLLAGPAFVPPSGIRRDVDDWYMANELPALDLPTDDWPYLYLKSRAVNPFYLSLMAILGAVAIMMVIMADRTLLTTAVRGGADWEMFLFGSAFLLLETRYVTAMNLLWGATWITSAVVFGAILLMVLLATLVTPRLPVRWEASAGLLVLSLAVSYVIRPHALLALQGGVRLLVSILYVGVPVFFAAVCFALRFSRRADAGRAFGWNLIGAVLGGLMEFLGMSVGFSALVLLTIACYLGVVLLKRAADRSAAVAALPGASG